MVDRDLILRKVADLDTYLTQLVPYGDLDVATYQDDWKTQRIVERTLHLTIETCMDIADHIVADRKLRVPDTGAATGTDSISRAPRPPVAARSLSVRRTPPSCPPRRTTSRHTTGAGSPAPSRVTRAASQEPRGQAPSDASSTAASRRRPARGPSMTKPSTMAVWQDWSVRGHLVLRANRAHVGFLDILHGKPRLLHVLAPQRATSTRRVFVHDDGRSCYRSS